MSTARAINPIQKWQIEEFEVADIIGLQGSLDALTGGAYEYWRLGGGISVDVKQIYYNGHVVKDQRGIAPIGWRVPTYTDMLNLRSVAGGSIAGGKLKSTGTTDWNQPNVGATNQYGFNAVAADTITSFGNPGIYSLLLTQTSYVGNGLHPYLHGSYLANYLTDFNVDNWTPTLDEIAGVRFVKNDSINPGSVTDCDGNIYGTIKIGDLVWTDRDAIVLHFNNGDAIPMAENAGSSFGLTSPLCVFSSTVSSDNIHINSHDLVSFYDSDTIKWKTTKFGKTHAWIKAIIPDLITSSSYLSEQLAGAVNGTNKIFSTSTAYEAGTISVFRCGLKCRDFTEISDTQIELDEAPLNTGFTDLIEAIFIKKQI